MLKKTSLISAYSSLQYCSVCSTPPPPSSKTSPSTRPPPRPRPSTRSCQNIVWRTYATVNDHRKGPDFRDNMNWPSKTSGRTTPTPYEIFELDRKATYTKHRYYQLVKLYHPDRHQYVEDGGEISHGERLERYRLVVQAHEILSDPVRRKAYDTYGAGWGGDARSTATRHTRGYSSASGRPYGFGPDYDSTVFGNATWEDWERWYRKQNNEPEKQQAYSGLYMNPNAFASFVILMAVLTGVIQATRAGQYSESMVAKVDAMTEETAQFLSARAREYDEKQQSKADDRVRIFLERRDPTRYGLKDEENESYKRHFGNVRAKAPPKEDLG